MKNQPKPNDFTVPLEGVGVFRFNRKNYGAQIKIDAIVSRILGPNSQGDEQDKVMRTHADLVACYGALMVDCPPGWEDIEAIDLTENPELETSIFQLYIALKEKLDSFRVRPVVQGHGAAGQEGGAPAAPDGAVLGAEPLQRPADGPALAGA